MNERHTIILSGQASGLLLLGFLALLILIFGVIPSIRRKVEKNKFAIFSCRAGVGFGPRWLKKGANFTRVSVYEDFLLFAFLGCTTFKYQNIKDLKLKKGIGHTVQMSANGMRVEVNGNIHDMKTLHDHLASRLKGR